MSVVFCTQQGTFLYREDLTVDDITMACQTRSIEVAGKRWLGHWSNDGTIAGVLEETVHASTRHIVEWWDPAERFRSGEPT